MTTRSAAAPGVIVSVAGFIATIVQYCPNHEWAFRGQPQDWDLLPKAYRDEFHLLTDKDDDLDRFERWCDQAIAFESNFPSQYLEQLALAQHYGLATRLMDWTANAVIALYFATEYQFVKNSTKAEPDGAVYLYRKQPKSATLLDEFKSKGDLRECEEVLFYRPRLVNRRILAQDGVFTVHPCRKRMEVRLFSSEKAESCDWNPGKNKKSALPKIQPMRLAGRTI